METSQAPGAMFLADEIHFSNFCGRSPHDHFFIIIFHFREHFLSCKKVHPLVAMFFDRSDLVQQLLYSQEIFLSGCVKIGPVV